MDTYTDAEIRVSKLAGMYNDQAAKYESGIGLAVGAAGINYRWKSDALRSLVKLVHDGVSVDDAATTVKAEAREWIKRHNSRRKDVSWQRWVGGVDGTIDNAERILTGG